MRLCSVPGCKRKHRAKGRCMMHYMRMKRRLGAYPEKRDRSEHLAPAEIAARNARPRDERGWFQPVLDAAA